MQNVGTLYSLCVEGLCCYCGCKHALFFRAILW